jgi:hypothetical protein
VIGYQTTGSYLLGPGIFFIVSLFVFYFAIRYNWNQLFPYLSMAIAVYLPLVLLSSLIKIHIGLPSEVSSLYMVQLCGGGDADTLCGEAIAHIAFSMAVRALPLVLCLPCVFWLALNYLNMHNPEDHIHG